MKVFHFYNGNGGGVLSVIRNLILYKQNTEIENHIIHVINKDLKPDYKIIELIEEQQHHASDHHRIISLRGSIELSPAGETEACALHQEAGVTSGDAERPCDQYR